MSYSYATYQYPQYTTAQQPGRIVINSPTSAGISRRATVKTSAPPPTLPQYSTGLSRSASQSRHQRTQFAPLPEVPPLRDVPVVSRSGTRSRRSNTVNVYHQTPEAANEYNPYPTRSSTVNYGSRTVGSQAPYDGYYTSSSRGRRASSAPPPIHSLRPHREQEDFNVGSATSAGRLYDEPHLPQPYADFSAGGRDTRRRIPRGEPAYAGYGDRYATRISPKSGNKGGGMFGWLTGHK